jgi:hypothetical protein
VQEPGIIRRLFVNEAAASVDEAVGEEAQVIEADNGAISGLTPTV